MTIIIKQTLILLFAFSQFGRGTLTCIPIISPATSTDADIPKGKKVHAASYGGEGTCGGANESKKHVYLHLSPGATVGFLVHMLPMLMAYAEEGKGVGNFAKEGIRSGMHHCCWIRPLSPSLCS